MAALPTYLHLGDEVITGGDPAVKPLTTTPQLAGLATMLVEYQRVVPSGLDGLTGGAFNSYYDGSFVRPWPASGGGASTISIATAQWKVNHFAGRTVTITAGTGSGQSRTVASNTTTQATTSAPWTTAPDATSVFNFGAGGLIPFHYIPGGVPGSGGDNWFEFASITPTGMLMQRLGQMYNNQAPGFRLLKIGQAYGAPGWKAGGAAHTQLMARYNDMKGLEEGLGNTLDPKAVILDFATRDVFGPNLNFEADLDDVIDTIRADISATALIVLVSPHTQIARTSRPGAAIAAQQIIRNTVMARKAAGDPNITLYEMNWGTFTWASGSLPTQVPADPRYYDLPTVIQTGIGLFNVIAAHYATPVTAPLGQSLAAVAVISDSQLIGVNPLMAFYTNQPSLVGSDPNTSISTKSNVWIWDDAMQQVVLYDVMANANTYGTVGNAGANVTLPRKLLKRYPQGVLLFQYALNGLALTPEAGFAAYIEDGGPTLDDIREKWTKARVSLLQTTNRSADAIGCCVSLGENDAAGGEASTTAFENRVGAWVDDIRQIFTTRVDGVLPLVWMQGPPPATEVTGGSVHGLAEHRNRYRAALVELEEAKPMLKVIRNNGPDDFELARDGIHYGGETQWKIGDRFALELIALITGEPAVGSGPDDGGGESEGAEGGAEGASEGLVESVEPSPEQQTQLQDAMFESPDIKRYRTPTGLEVERFGAEDTIARVEFARRESARRARLTHTLARFD